MHIPDGFINAPTSLAAGAVAAGGVGVSLRRAAETLQEKQAPLAGLVAAYIFAVQMLNFPVAAGTSGHLLGGALAAVLVGPWAGALCVSVVLLVQGLLFADGGLTALGAGGDFRGQFNHGRMLVAKGETAEALHWMALAWENGNARFRAQMIDYLLTLGEPFRSAISGWKQAL